MTEENAADPVPVIAHVLHRQWEVSPRYAEALARQLIEGLAVEGFSITQTEAEK